MFGSALRVTGINSKTLPESFADAGISQRVLESIIDSAKKNGIRKLCLFGSRARGDHDKKSDIDLAVYDGNAELFKLDIDESVPTLLMFDVVDMKRTSSEELKKIVEKEGIVLYEEV